MGKGWVLWKAWQPTGKKFELLALPTPCIKARKAKAQVGPCRSCLFASAQRNALSSSCESSSSRAAARRFSSSENQRLFCTLLGSTMKSKPEIPVVIAPSMINRYCHPYQSLKVESVNQKKKGVGGTLNIHSTSHPIGRHSRISGR